MGRGRPMRAAAGRHMGLLWIGVVFLINVRVGWAEAAVSSAGVLPHEEDAGARARGAATPAAALAPSGQSRTRPLQGTPGGTPVFEPFSATEEEVLADLTDPKTPVKERFLRHIDDHDLVGKSCLRGARAVSMRNFGGAKAYQMFDPQANFGFPLPVRHAIEISRPPWQPVVPDAELWEQAFIPVLSSLPLDVLSERSRKIDRVIIALQSYSKNKLKTPASNFFDLWTKEFWEASANEHVLLLRPWFPTDDAYDKSIKAEDWDPASNLPGNTTSIHWPSRAAYKDGRDSVKGHVCSFDILDQLVEKLQVDFRSNFPNLRDIVMFGYSGGATVGINWSILSEWASPSKGPASVQVIVGAAMNWPYFDELRPTEACNVPHSAAAPKGFVLERPFQPYANCTTFAVPEIEGCDQYHRYPYGFGYAFSDYFYVLRFMHDRELLESRLRDFANRKVFFMVGSWDDCNCNSPSYEKGPYAKKTFTNAPGCYHKAFWECSDTWTSASWKSVQSLVGKQCQKSFQGWTRMQRMRNFMGYLTDFFKRRYNIDYHPSHEVFIGNHEYHNFLSHPAFTSLAFGFPQAPAELVKV